MRLIDADVPVKEIRCLKEKASTFGHQDYRVGYISALSCVEGMIASALTIDAEPVVRCKDCRHWDRSRRTPSGSHFCFCTMMHTAENHYCGYGSKMDLEV